MTLELLSLPLNMAAALLLAATGGTPPPDDSAEMRTAPEAARGNAPSEATLTPPPDSEKDAQASSSIVELHNPAFPRPLSDGLLPKKPDPGTAYGPEQLAPYFAEGERAAAKALFDRGAWLDARKKLAGLGDAPPVRYLRALAAVRADLHEDAAKEMSALAAEYPPLRDRCLTHAGAAFEALRQWDAAANSARGVSRGSKMWPDAQLTLFRALRAAGRLDEAAESLLPLTYLPPPGWGRDLGAEALVALADLERSRKRPDEERAALLKLWAQHPLSPLAKGAEARLNLKQVPLERWVDRGEALVEAHRNRDGLAVLEPLLPKLKLPEPGSAPEDLLACRAHFVAGKALRKEREHSRAIRTLAPVVERCDDPDLRPRALYVLGSSRSIVDLAHGAGTYELLARDYPAHSFADDALYYAADIYLRHDDVETALARLGEIGERYPDGDFSAEALFKSFWILRDRPDPAEAFAVLDRLEAIFARAAESYEVERAKYWRARLHEKGGNPARAAEILFQLAVDHPATYYGLISRRRLEKLDPERFAQVQASLNFPPAGNFWPLHAGPLSRDPHFLTAIELYRLGFPEAVTSELLAANRAAAPAEAVRLVVHLLSMTGDARAAHAVARTSLRGDLSGRITEQTRPIWEVAYPLAFRNLVVKHTRSAGIEPDLLQALMREESALDPRALSWAGALGLTQLMPYTARAVAAQLQLKNVTTQRLLEPDLNIQIGSAYLGDLVKRFDGVYEYALAGYNAGGGAVSRWKRQRPTLELDEWVEEIPISETRGYVKRVLRSFNTYTLLYPATSPDTVSRAALR